MSRKMMWCPHCGEELPLNAVRCSSCGEWLRPRAARPAPAGGDRGTGGGRESDDAKSSRISRGRWRRRLWFGFVLAAGIAAAVVFGLLHLQPAGETTAAGRTATTTPTPVTSPAPGVSPSASPTGYPAGLAQQTAQKYWDLISRGDADQAYDLLSGGAMQGTTRRQFVRGITRLLDVTNGVSAVAGVASVHGATASVEVSLRFTSSRTSQATQRLVWEQGAWRIDQAPAPLGPKP
jgi:hypothetical protein